MNNNNDEEKNKLNNEYNYDNLKNNKSDGINKLKDENKKLNNNYYTLADYYNKLQSDYV